MKKRIKMIMILFLTAMVCGCESYLDKHQEFIKDSGEAIYLQKIDSCASYTGMDRVKLELWYTNAHNLTNTTIYYNNKADSVVISLDGMKPGKDVKIYELPLPEGNYDLEIVNNNKYGQSSLATNYFISTYGENYLSRLENRGVKKSTYTEPDLFNVSWFPTPDNYVFLEFKYKDENSKEQILRIYDENEINLEGNADVFTYRTAYIPEEQVIDTFYTAWSKDVEIYMPEYWPLDRTGWSATANTEEPKEGEWGLGGLAEHLIDNNFDTYWHSKWEGGKDPLPYIINIDMQKNQQIISLELLRRNDELRAVSFEISIDNVNFTPAGELNFANGEQAGKVLQYDEVISGRYFRATVTAGKNNDAVIREIYFTGVN